MKTNDYKTIRSSIKFNFIRFAKRRSSQTKQSEERQKSAEINTDESKSAMSNKKNEISKGKLSARPSPHSFSLQNENKLD